MMQKGLFGMFEHADWGVYNAISNGGDEPDLWRTLTADEWQYLLQNNDWTIGKIGKDSVVCLILIPEDFKVPAEISLKMPTKEYKDGKYSFEEDYFADNVFSADDFTQLERLGAVALPSGGRRIGSKVQTYRGFYWSSSAATDEVRKALGFQFDAKAVLPNNEFYRYYGSVVRLVQNEMVDVKFLNYDGSVLLNTAVRRWNLPSFTGTPQRESSRIYSYTFIGWDKDIAPAYKNIVYTAEYDSFKVPYTSVFTVEGKEFLTLTDCAFDSVPDSIPNVFYTEEGKYRFDSWNRDMSKIANDTLIYTAVFDSCFRMKKNGAIRKAYKVSDTTTVFFSQGNLQFNAMEGSHKTADSTARGTWHFAENQFDFIGKFDNEKVDSLYDGLIDYFSWGTSGWNSGAKVYQPWSISPKSNDFLLGKLDTVSLVGDYANADWGVYNAISNGGDQPGMWRTLTTDEWQYLVLHNRWTLGEITSDDGDNILCFMLIPEDFKAPENLTVKELETTEVVKQFEKTEYEGNLYTKDQFQQLEDSGVVALPLFSSRICDDGYKVAVPEDGGLGFYWSSSAKDDARAYLFVCTSIGVNTMYDFSKSYGLFVRLVKDVK